MNKELKNTDIVLKVGVITDIHLNASKINEEGHPFQHAQYWLKKACEFYKKVNAEVLLITGDYVDFTREDNYALLSETFKEIYGSYENAPEIILAAGNHEYTGFWDEKTGSYHYPSIKEIFGLHKKYLENWTVGGVWNGEEGKESEGDVIQICRKKDVTIIGYSPDKRGGAYSIESAKRLENAIKTASENSDKPVILGMHEPVGDYVTGGWCEVQRWRNPLYDAKIKHLIEILKKYPDLVVITGHTHFSILAENNISQDDGWTNINAGGVSIMGMNRCVTHDDGTSVYVNDWLSDGHFIDNVSGDEYYPYDRNEKPLFTFNMNHEGLLLNFTKEKLIIDRIDLNNQTKYSNVESYIIGYGINPFNKKSKFQYLVKNGNKRPEHYFAFDKGEKTEIYFENNELCVSFKGIKNYFSVECYVVELYRNNILVGVKYWASDYMLQPHEQKRFTVRFYSEIIGSYENSEYYAVVYPRDFYGNSYMNEKSVSDILLK